MAGRQEEEVAIRSAATVVLARDGADGPEVFMLERNIKSEFVSGAYVFPGGAVDKHDSQQVLEEICTGVDDRWASQQTGLTRGGLGFWVAAIRECFEECGVLIANSTVGPVDFDTAEVARRYSAHRDSLNRRESSFSDICRAENLTLPVDQLTYFSRWVTPEGMAKRFDTCFFICTMPARQTPLHDGHETVSGLWVTPESALLQGKSGKIKLVPATIKTLETLSGYPSVESMLAGCTPTTKVPVICPQIIRDSTGQPLRIRMPLPEGDVELDIGDELRTMIGSSQ